MVVANPFISNSIEALYAEYNADKAKYPPGDYDFVVHGLKCTARRGDLYWLGRVQVDDISWDQVKKIISVCAPAEDNQLRKRCFVATISDSSVTLAFACDNDEDFISGSLMSQIQLARGRSLRCWRFEDVVDKTSLLAHQIVQCMMQG